MEVEVTMAKAILFAAAMLCCGGIHAQSSGQKAVRAANAAPAAGPAFEVATIKPVEPGAEKGRYIIMQGTNRFVEKDYTLMRLIGAAYDLSPKVISGGPAWMDSDHYDIVAITPGAKLPTHDEQMAMLRNLLADRFKLTFHREQQEFSIYVLEVAKGGPKLTKSTAPESNPAQLISTVYPQRIHLPARNATMGEFASLLQRALLDRPVVNKTALAGRYDFDLDWAPDETQFGGEVPVARSDAPSPPFFTAIEQQIGLKVTATRGPVEAFVVDTAERPSAN